MDEIKKRFEGELKGFENKILELEKKMGTMSDDAKHKVQGEVIDLKAKVNMLHAKITSATEGGMEILKSEYQKTMASLNQGIDKIKGKM